MTTIKLHNTRTRQKEVFTPIDPDNVRMYVCGPTVYDRAHIGNARPVVVFDTLFRLLRHVYGPDHVTYVRNFTDVDDKINARAAQSGRSIAEITAETTQWYLDDMGALGALEPTHMPRATAYIGAMIAMIEDLIAKGHAYEAEGHVLFAVDSYKAYGRLSGRSVDDMIAGARVEVAPYKRNPMDFVLWKPSSDDLPGWDSPWGRGRPGWHIECSAMSYELLGATFDIHGGGNDLMFPHHENEIAQSCCAHPEGHFANYWLHNEMLQVEGKKMSKSLGNFFTVHDLLEKGVPGEVIRYVFLSTQYRKPMDWTEKKRQEAEATLQRWRQLTEFVEPTRPSKKVIAALADDLNTPLVLTELEKIADRKDAGTLKASANLVGLLSDRLGAWSWKRRPVADFDNLPEWHPARVWISEVTKPLVDVLKSDIGAFKGLSASKAPRFDFSFKMPEIKVPKIQLIKPETVEGLKRLGNYFERLRKEYPDEFALLLHVPFSALDIRTMNAIRHAKIAEKIADRNRAKLEKDYEKSDRIRFELEDLGLVLKDTKDGAQITFAEDFDPAKLEGL